jgi:2-isopropylmalate synthase
MIFGPRPILVYDTTLRDGNQGEDVNFSIADKLRIAEQLDLLGVHFIEGGWPSASPKDARFFEEMLSRGLKRSKLVAFGSTRKKGVTPARDRQVAAMAKLPVKYIALVGKTWELHIREVLHTAREENLKMIRETVAYLKDRGKQVFFDAEHFFDGFRESEQYAQDCIGAAVSAGADLVCLCDTNGGALPSQVADTWDRVMPYYDIEFGIHAHNDGGLAVANTLTAVEHGAAMVQGTINGFGERCGNADLCSVIPDLMLKMKCEVIPEASLKKLRQTSHLAWELVNRSSDSHQPYVGDSAFAHKGGQHADAVLKNSRTYEHIDPALVGNRNRILVSDQAGRSTILHKAREVGLDLDREDPAVIEVLDQVKRLESQGYEYEGADASFELLMQKAQGKRKQYFKFKGFRVTVEKRPDDLEARAEATIMVEVEGQGVEHTAAEGDGPVNALDNALRKALERFFPTLKKMRLTDYKVRVLPAGLGTASQVRVLCEYTDGRSHWGTVGVSENIIEASWQALTDSVVYKLYLDEKRSKQKHARKSK